MSWGNKEEISSWLLTFKFQLRLNIPYFFFFSSNVVELKDHMIGIRIYISTAHLHRLGQEKLAVSHFLAVSCIRMIQKMQ